jgi:hypothetical protein|tara:strand:- start:45 stop:191 length:147 start_codon:yes stop_codon:yes gene_type:complete
VQATAAAAASEAAEYERQEAYRIKKKEGIPHDIPFACVAIIIACGVLC